MLQRRPTKPLASSAAARLTTSTVTRYSAVSAGTCTRSSIDILVEHRPLCNRCSLMSKRSSSRTWEARWRSPRRTAGGHLLELPWSRASHITGRKNVSTASNANFCRCQCLRKRDTMWMLSRLMETVARTRHLKGVYARIHLCQLSNFLLAYLFWRCDRFCLLLWNL